MTDALSHRGPDDAGVMEERSGGRHVVLGHRRLSILDLSERGHQPMLDEASGVLIVYNGEVYNFEELRQELGIETRSGTDTEVVLAAYCRWGRQSFSRFRGMFALAIWDPRSSELVLARDPMGIKPLYYGVSDADGGPALWFASELRALLVSGQFPRKLCQTGLANYLWNGFVPGPHTLVDGIRLLPAGTSVALSTLAAPSDVRPQRYTESASVKSGATLADAHAELERAVQLRLVSDVPLGVFLSGGVDSTVVAAMAQRTSSGPVSTFNIAFEEARYNEAEYARSVAKQLGTDHHEVVLKQETFRSQLPDALSSLDQPTFDAINTYFVSRAVKEAGITVALSGAGGDELFGGYSSFKDLPQALKLAQVSSLLPDRAHRWIGHLASRVKLGPPGDVRPQTRWGKLEDLLGARGDVTQLYQASYALFTKELLEELQLASPSDSDYGVSRELQAELVQAMEGRSTLSSISEAELRMFLRERLLRDTDTTSMAVALEVRVPLIDVPFVDMLRQLRDEERYRVCGTKQALRESVAGQIDPSTFDRDKAGFELPLNTWCRDALRPEMAALMKDLNLCHAVGLNAETVSRIWHAFQSGAPGMYWSRVWSLFTLLWWCRKNEVYA